MARNGAFVYSKPAGTTPIDGDTVSAAPFNLLMDDFVADLNLARPIAVGGTGATTATAALTAFGLSADGKSLVTAADYAAMRTALGLGTAATTAATAYATAAQGGLADTALQTITLASQAEAEAGVEDTKTMTPLRTKQSIAANVAGIGVGQTWTNVTGSRSVATSYQNTTGNPIQVLIQTNVSVAGDFQVSPNNSTWTTIYDSIGGSGDTNVISVIVPNLIYYKLLASDDIKSWAELR